MNYSTVFSFPVRRLLAETLVKTLGSIEISTLVSLALRYFIGSSIDLFVDLPKLRLQKRLLGWKTKSQSIYFL